MIKKFELKYRSKHRNNNIFYCAKKALINGAIFSHRLKNNKKLTMKRSDIKFLNQNDGIFSIKQEKDGKYYICLSITEKIKYLTQKDNICALDPGVRTFQTMFSQESIGEFGFNTSKKLYSLYKREDRLKSIISKENIKQSLKTKLHKQCAKLRTKAQHIVNDLHWKTCDFLTKNYQTILLPIFNSKQMANKNRRKLSKTSTRLLLGLSHYQFQQKLLFKAKMRGRNVILCKEHYTSKCCGKCGILNEKLGSKKIFECANCNLVMDRDIHAARNILIRALSIYLDKTLG
jgi:putative transposase